MILQEREIENLIPVVIEFLKVNPKLILKDEVAIDPLILF
jgi:hypothetical protein